MTKSKLQKFYAQQKKGIIGFTRDDHRNDDLARSFERVSDAIDAVVGDDIEQNTAIERAIWNAAYLHGIRAAIDNSK